MHVITKTLQALTTPRKSEHFWVVSDPVRWKLYKTQMPWVSSLIHPPPPSSCCQRLREATSLRSPVQPSRIPQSSQLPVPATPLFLGLGAHHTLLFQCTSTVFKNLKVKKGSIHIYLRSSSKNLCTQQPQRLAVAFFFFVHPAAHLRISRDDSCSSS